MIVLGSVILCIEPENSNTHELYALVMRQLREEKILLSYSDMWDWGMLAEHFPWVPEMKMEIQVRKVRVTPKKVKKTQRKMPKKTKMALSTSIPPGLGGDDNLSVTPFARGDDKDRSTENK